MHASVAEDEEEKAAAVKERGDGGREIDGWAWISCTSQLVQSSFGPYVVFLSWCPPKTGNLGEHAGKFHFTAELSLRMPTACCRGFPVPTLGLQ